MTSEDAPGPDPMLRGELVHLTAVDQADIVEDSRWISDAEIAHHLGMKAPIGRQSAERFAQQLIDQVGKTLFAFNICRNEDGRRIGGIVLRDIDRENGRAEVALFLAEPPLLGRGYGTDALRCTLDFGFGEQRLERIELKVFDYNRRAQRSYEKAGFRTDVVLRHARYHRGQHHDVLVMSILRDEWQAQDRRRAWDPAG